MNDRAQIMFMKTMMGLNSKMKKTKQKTREKLTKYKSKWC